MKRKSSEPELEELPLFDFPLREKATSPRPRRPATEAAAAPTVATPSASAAASAAASYVAGPGAAQLELDEADPAAETQATVAATIGDRFFAGLADLLIHLATLGLTALAVLAIGHTLAWRDLPPFAFFGVLFSFLYCVFSLAFWGQTPGMAWAGHLARSVTGEPLTFGQTALRWLGGLLTLILAGLPLLLALVGGRSLSDRISDSKTLQL